MVTTIEETINRELYKKVEKKSLTQLLPRYKFPPGFDYAIVDKKKGKILNFCSSRYKLELNSNIFLPVEESLKALKLPYIRKVKIVNSSKFYVDYIIKDRKNTPSINDVLPKISLWNSYDGVITRRVEMGFYKLICQNGLTTLSKKWQEIWKKHSTDNTSDEFVEEFLLSLKGFLNESKKELNVFERMNQKIIKIKTLKRIGQSAGLSERLLLAAVDRFKKEVKGGMTYINEHGESVNHNGSPQSLFTAYNARNYALYNNNEIERESIALIIFLAKIGLLIRKKKELSFNEIDMYFHQYISNKEAINNLITNLSKIHK